MAIESEKDIDISKYRAADGSIKRPDWIDDDIELRIEDGVLWGEGPHGEFTVDPPRGSPMPREGKCGMPLKYAEKRYGEKRYCNMWQLTDGITCHFHTNMTNIMDNWSEMIEHGAFAQKYLIFVEKLSPLKFIFAVEMFSGLLEMSELAFDVEHEVREIDTTDSIYISEDSVTVTLPIPTNKQTSFNAAELWEASLDQIKMQNIQETLFDDGMESETITATSDDSGTITDTIVEKREHHLHLPLSRLTKDVKNHLKNGGIDINGDDSAGSITFQKNDYTLDVGPQNEYDSKKDVGETGDVASEFTKQVSDKFDT